MGIKVFLGKVWASLSVKNMQKWMLNAPAKQDEIFQQLIKKGRNTTFGKDHHFDKINSYEDYKKYVPIHDYEDLRPYIDQILAGEEDVLWPKKPLYFAKTSGKRFNNSLVFNNKSSKSIAPLLKQRSTYC